VAGAALAVLLGACQPVQQGPVGDGGFVELDENTDPRFLHYDRGDVIGRLRIAGTRVYLNGRLVDRDQRLPNHAHVRTGPASGVRAELAPGTGSSCRVAVRELVKGNLYAETRTCVHELGTRQGGARAEGPRATYHASARGDLTVLTVIAGQMQAWSVRDPAHSVPVGAYQEVELRPGGVVGPRRVSEAQVRARTAWRAAFDWEGRSEAAAACERYAAVAVRQNEENLKRGCDFTGPRWQSEARYHVAWCLEADNRQQADRETEARARALKQCARADQGSGTDDAAGRALIDWVLSVGQRRPRTTTTDPKPPPSDAGTPPRSDPTPPATDSPAIELDRVRATGGLERTPTPPPSDIR
jgi:hypothetical protein